MRIPATMPCLKGYRFPREIIACAVCAYYRFALSTADVEDLLAERGVIASRLLIRHRTPIIAPAKASTTPIEGSHRPTRRREKIMGRFKSPGQAQGFLTAHDRINTILRPPRYRLSATSYRHARADAFCLRADYAAEMVA